MNSFIIEQCPPLYIDQSACRIPIRSVTGMISFLFLAWILNSGDAFNEFPSLMSANATMAVVIDKGFFDNKHEYHNTVRNIYGFITSTIREEMQMIDINVRIFRNTKIKSMRDFTALLSVATCEQTWSLHDAASKEEVVHLAITEPDCPRFSETEGVSIPLISAGKELSQIFLDLRSVDAFNWNSINILHDDTFDRDSISKVTQAISIPLPNKKFNMVSRSLFAFKHADSQRNRRFYIKDMLESFHVDQLGKCFLVIVTIDAASDVMEVARELNMIQPDSQWLYVIADSIARNGSNITNFVDYLSEGVNVAFAYNATDSETYCDAKLMCHVQELTIALTNAIKLSLMIEIELYNRVNEEEFELIRLSKHERHREILKNIQIKLIDDTFASGGGCGKCLFWRFASAITWGNFFIRGKSTAHLIDSGTWLPSLGVNLTDVIFPHISHGFRGISLPIATYHNPPWSTIQLARSGVKEYGGLVFDVVKYLAQKLNFTYTVISPANSRVIKFKQNETKTEVVLKSNTREMPSEIIDMVRMKKVLLAACAYTVNDRGKEDINFTLPIFIQTYSFLTTKPGQLSRALLFTAPFAKETWACLAASIIIMGPILYLIHKYSLGTQTVGLNSCWQCVWYVYGALLQQGGMYLPRCDSARLLVGVWWLVVMVLVATYSGSLVAFLTFPNMDVAILTVEELVAHKGKVTWGFPNGSFLEEYLKNAEEEKYHTLWEYAEIYNETQEVEVLEKVKAGKHVIIDWRSTLRFLMRTDMLSTGGCSFSLSTAEFMDEPIAMIIGQDSPYTKIINAELHRMHESGLMTKWISEQIPAKDKCSDNTVNQAVEERKVNVSDMQGIFFVLFMGVTGSIFFLCCEFLWHKHQVAKRRKLIEPFLS
ncbi:LOW QUALITY PROTEIN: ionotropic receptor 93a-like [Odontomachus brunneus]|uniref:LOW QUALITY PROTEIN: ionotropic receptor 93a-like n=1 Tax=Odontomachus brunneus TaxID=486640 RepID=UPI0013F20E36|nr:LOW QUALITY PROTEIN: ionotropic receptor 93a-like [Odontomachus brunneus]